ncbi:MAG: metallophosphoesterase [Pirellulales bacterium]|nr:metallophosphoesterase [Pirellulales bacterium]
MKILCFSDLHRDQQAARQLVLAANDADVVIGAGDFATRREGIEDTIDILSQIEQPSVLVPGNSESAEELSLAAERWAAAHVLHGNGCRILEVDFWGVGGGIPVTPFGSWSYDFDEAQAETLLRGCPSNGVLVVHSPPIDTVDRDSNGKIRGSQAIRQIVETKLPKLVVCGHIHSDWEKEVSVGPTRILNAGPRGVLLNLEV